MLNCVCVVPRLHYRLFEFIPGLAAALPQQLQDLGPCPLTFGRAMKDIDIAQLIHRDGSDLSSLRGGAMDVRYAPNCLR